MDGRLQQRSSGELLHLIGPKEVVEEGQLGGQVLDAEDGRVRIPIRMPLGGS